MLDRSTCISTCEVPECDQPAFTYSWMRDWQVCFDHAYGFERERVRG